MIKKQRTCITCGAQAHKGELHRIVRDGEGTVSVDPRGTQPGRGAYVCSLTCLDKAIATRRIERALRVGMSKEDHERIVGEFTSAMREV